MRQMITSFILNSVEAINHADGSIRIHTGMLELGSDALRGIAPSTELQPGRYVFISVTDNGVGMEPEIREKVFDPFFSTKFAGRGLGLAAVQGIVKRHRGAIQLESEPGRGSSFRVILPVSAHPVQAPVTPPAAQVSPEPQVAASNGKHHDSHEVSVSAGNGKADSHQPELARARQSAEVAVAEPVPLAEALAPQHQVRRAMVVAQESTVRQVTSRILEQHGYSVQAVTEGRGAIQEFSANGHTYELVLLDMDLSDMSGHDLFAALSRLNPEQHIVLITGEVEAGVLTSPSGNRAVVLRKPFSPAQLMQEIEARA
jgi:CheY-like chemotaxis protein